MPDYRKLAGLFSQILPDLMSASTGLISPNAAESMAGTAAYNVLENPNSHYHNDALNSIAGRYAANELGDTAYQDWVPRDEYSQKLKDALTFDYESQGYPTYGRVFDPADQAREAVDVEASLKIPRAPRRPKNLIRETVDAEAPLVTRWKNIDRLYEKAQQKKARRQ